MQIGRMGAVAIAKAVASCSKLEKLELDENQISEDGITHLKVSILPYFPSVNTSPVLFLKMICVSYEEAWQRAGLWLATLIYSDMTSSTQVRSGMGIHNGTVCAECTGTGKSAACPRLSGGE